MAKHCVYAFVVSGNLLDEEFNTKHIAAAVLILQKAHESLHTHQDAIGTTEGAAQRQRDARVDAASCLRSRPSC